MTQQNDTVWTRAMMQRMGICTIIGFSSGLPLFVFLNLLPAWANDYQIDIKTIGFMTLLQVPYVFKFLWAPFLDLLNFNAWGRRRTWLIILPLLLTLLLGYLGQTNPKENMPLVTIIGLLISFFSASLDIVIDAYRREILPDAELGLGNTIHVQAYKIAGLIPGSLALILSAYLSWEQVFFIVALFMLPCFVLAIFIKEPELKQLPPKTLRDAVILPLQEFFQRQGVNSALLLLSFIFLFKLGDSLATALSTKFYLDMGFTKPEIGAVAKLAGFWGSIIGGFVGGFLMLKMSLNRSLWIFGIIQLLVIPLFAWLAEQPIPHLFNLGFVVGAEAFGVGLGTAAFVAFIAKSTNPLYTATQLALLTSLAALPRTVVNSYAGVMIEGLGYTQFFYLCTLLGIPGLLLLFKIAPWHEKS